MVGVVDSRIVGVGVHLGVVPSCSGAGHWLVGGDGVADVPQ